jgi:hypothetical protein
METGLCPACLDRLLPMRLRPSQFVFLLLLLCSVQWTDTLTHPLAEIVAGSVSKEAGGSVVTPGGASQGAVPSARLCVARVLVDSAKAAALTAVPHCSQSLPVVQAASVASHTGLRRA